MKQAYKQQQRGIVRSKDSIGGWLHHLHRSVKVRSDAWVMVQVSRNRLALLYLYATKRLVSPNFLRSLIFYVMMYHTVRNYKERFGIRIKIQTVVTFLDIGTCTRCLHVRTRYVSFIPYVDTTTAAAA